jgi:hypothetical protein
MPDWSGSFTSPPEELERSLSEHWNRHGQQIMTSLARPLKRWLVPLAVLVVAAWFVFGWVNAAITLAVASAMGAATSVSLHRRSNSVCELLSQAQKSSIRQLRAAGSELKDWFDEFRTADAEAAEVRLPVEPLRDADHVHSLGEHPTTVSETWHSP